MSALIGKPPDGFFEELSGKIFFYAKEAFAFMVLPILQERAISAGRIDISERILYDARQRTILLWIVLALSLAALVGSFVGNVGAYALNSANVSGGSAVTASPAAVITIKSQEDIVLPAAPIMQKRERFEVIESGPMKEKEVAFGPLAGRNFGKWKNPLKGEVRNPNSLYSGVEGKAEAFEKVNFCKQMKIAWQAKVNRKQITPAAQKAIPYITDQYCNGTRTITDLKTYVGDVDERIVESYTNLDFEGLCEKQNVDEAGCHVVKTLAESIDGEHIVAYGMTELMPNSVEGIFNARLLDQNLRYAGLEFWMSVPALGDPLASKGLYQFTSYAIGHDNSGRKGASVVNGFLPKKYRTSDSVVGPLGLKADEHDRAAYHFVLYNTLTLVSKLNERERNTLLKVINDGRMDELAEFFATSHHAPAPVRKAAKKWLADGAKKPFKSYLKGRFVPYAKKTRVNLIGLRDFLKN